MHSGWTELDILHEARSFLLQPVFLETEQYLQILGGSQFHGVFRSGMPGTGQSFIRRSGEFLSYEKLHDGGYGLGF